jgi:APA family basic amino acid/polyamine antiporter
MLVLPIWGAIGLVIYYVYGYSRSHVGRGLIEVPEAELNKLEPDVPGTH